MALLTQAFIVMEAVMANSNKIILTSYKMHALPFIKKNKKN